MFFNRIDAQDLIVVLTSILVTSLFIFYIKITSKFKKDGVYFSQNGVTYIFKNNTHFMEWENLRITKKTDLKYFMKVDLNIPNQHGFNFNLLIFWPTEKDMIAKTKKYCPKEHELYRVIENYAKNKNLSF